MKEVEKLVETLHPLERAVLPVLEDDINLNSIISKTNLQEVEVLRALQWLESKNIVKIKKEQKEIIELDENGKKYLINGLPEKRFLKVLEKPLALKEIREKANLSDEELNISLGILKRKNAIKIDNEVSLTETGKLLIIEEFFEEQFLKSLPIELSKLTQDQKEILEDLRRRKQLIKINKERLINVYLTDLGKRLSKLELKQDFIDSLTPSLLKTGVWKGKKFRRFNLSSEAPKIYPGKRHFVNQAIQYIKRIWLEMGFKEMRGSIIETAFWNFDSLFVPQDHPAREMQDTFFVKGSGKLPENEIVNKVRNIHEKGWKYKWNPEVARKLLLRTHTTVLSARTLAQIKKEELPAKYFSVAKCFRNEALDWKHSFEFNQVEGIVVDENANFRHLLGYLKQYYKKLGFDEVRFNPIYFPFTEMSVETAVYNKERKEWVELGGAGIFRPEVVVPLLGKDIPVLAWGQGMERGIMDYYKIKDFRDLYNNDLKLLREIKAWLK